MAHVGENAGINTFFAAVSEVYEDENIRDSDLETALEAGVKIILIEPGRLGDETARWIAVGNYLHKTAVAAGMMSVATAFIWKEKPIIYLPFGVLSLLCTGAYTLSWQFDPCEKYQVEKDFKKLLREFPELGVMPVNSKGSLEIFSHYTTNTPVFLVRRDNSNRKTLHSGLSLVAAMFCIWRLYDAFK